MMKISTTAEKLSMALLGMIMMAACSDHALPEKNKAFGAPLQAKAMPGASADGTAAPSMPSASDVFAAEPAPDATEVAKGGTDDMKKTLSKTAEETQMPLVGHGNNHSAPDATPTPAVPTKR